MLARPRNVLNYTQKFNDLGQFLMIGQAETRM